MGKLTKQQEEVIKLFRNFREREPGRVKHVELDIPKSLMVMGTLDMIGYRTSHGRRSVVYTHDFQPGSRPMLCAGPEDNQLFIIGGRYRVTEQGIVDIDARGRLMLDPDHGKEDDEE